MKSLYTDLEVTAVIPLDAPSAALLTDKGSLFGPCAPLSWSRSLRLGSARSNLPDVTSQDTTASPPLSDVSRRNATTPLCAQYKRVDPIDSLFKFGNGSTHDFKFNTPPFAPSKIQFGDNSTKKWF